MKARASASQMALFAESEEESMEHAFARLPKPTGHGVTLLCIAVTRDQRAVIDRAAEAVAAEQGQRSIAGVAAGSPAALADVLARALAEWLDRRKVAP